MLGKCLILAAVVAGLALVGCGSSGPGDPMPPEDMPMQVPAADSAAS